MEIILFLILFPAFVALLMLVLPPNLFQKIIIAGSSIMIIAGSVSLLIYYFNLEGPVYFEFNLEAISKIILAIEILISGYIFYLGIRFKKYLICLLVAIQLCLSLAFELLYGNTIHVQYNLYIDKFSVIMALIIGIIGSLICVYSIGYMKEFHEEYHKELRDSRRVFFFIMFIFLSAMYGIIFSNNLSWMFFFWEITTVCSFLLIRYKKNQESVNNAFRALYLNLIGGVGFVAAIIILYHNERTLELTGLLSINRSYALIPAVFLAFAGLTKSAQMPFSSWLTGAMVAPTPVSALLHSSTMVKAGVFLILKLAPIFQGTRPGFMLSLVGGTTFLIASFICISQNNSKKVLAYSTIANLGLIVSCGGIGTYEAVWSGILLIIFHAVAKSLLFLGVGIIEHKMESRDIERMDNLIVRMPRLGVMMVIGIAGMFLAPFGMLISKWATLKAFVDANPILAILLVFGSAATLFFWAKWMGKVISINNNISETAENNISIAEWIPLFIISFFTIAVCGVFPLMSSVLIEPYVISIYGKSVSMGGANILIILIIMLGLAIMLPLSLLYYIYLKKYFKQSPVYLGGGNVDDTRFMGSLGGAKDIVLKNYYMEKLFGEKRLYYAGLFTALTMIIIMVGIVVI